MNESQIYDFEGIVENACGQVLSGLGFAAFSTQDPPTAKKPRPRFEVKYVHGPGLSRFSVIVNGQNVALNPAASQGLTSTQLYNLRRESAWSFNIKFCLITINDPVLHTQWKVAFRAAVAQLWTLVNGVYLTRHSIFMTRDAGNSELMLNDQKSLYRTDFLFEGNISVNADAWSVLTPQQPTS